MNKHTKRAIVGGIIITLIVILGFCSTYTVQENEKAVVVTLGSPQLNESVGLNFKIPFVQKVIKVDTTSKGLAIGYTIGDTPDDAVISDYTNESLMITSDFNFVNVDFYAEYEVSDPVKYLYNSEKPVDILKNLAQAEIRTVVSSYDVDSVITTGKNEIQALIKERLIKDLEEEDIGLRLLNITIQDAEPPTEEVRAAFKAVETAKQGAETAENEANKYTNEKVPEAKAKADKLVKDAEATKQARINEATGQTSRFESLYAEYCKYPLITKQRMFYETMADVLPDTKVVINSSNSNINSLFPIESLTGNGSVQSSTNSVRDTANEDNQISDINTDDAQWNSGTAEELYNESVGQ